MASARSRRAVLGIQSQTLRGGYAIDTVQTPDEYATDTNNDAYTNASASLALNAAIKAAAILGKTAPPGWAESPRSH